MRPPNRALWKCTAHGVSRFGWKVRLMSVGRTGSSDFEVPAGFVAGSGDVPFATGLQLGGFAEVERAWIEALQEAGISVGGGALRFRPVCRSAARSDNHPIRACHG